MSNDTLQHELENPLTAERYWSNMTETYVRQLVNNEEVKKSDRKTAKFTEWKNQALEQSHNAEQVRRQGMLGAFNNMKFNTARGLALLLGQRLYFGTDFECDPGMNLHVYLSKTVDPRDVSFPDRGSIDLGVMRSAYGAQSYDIPGTSVDPQIRTVVLYDQATGLIHSFAQLSKQP